MTPAVAFVGCVDHGKSTLIGRLLLEGGALPRPERQRLRKLQHQVGLPAALANLLDSLPVEREELFTLDTTRRFFGPRTRRFALIDTPGHQELLSRMLSGATQAQAAVLVLDPTSNDQEDVQRYIRTLEFLDFPHVGVVLTKADLHHEHQAQDLGNLKVRWTLPVSAVTGYNVKALLPRLRNLLPQDQQDEPFRLLVQGQDDDATRGLVVSGQCSKGQQLTRYPQGTQHTVTQLDRDLQEGDFATLTLDGTPPRRGDVLATTPPRTTRHPRLGVLWLTNEPPPEATRLTLRCGFQKLSARLHEIHHTHPGPPRRQEVRLELDEPLVYDPAVPALSRAVLTRDGAVVGMALVRPEHERAGLP